MLVRQHSKLNVPNMIAGPTSSATHDIVRTRVFNVGQGNATTAVVTPDARVVVVDSVRSMVRRASGTASIYV